jgi:hypothetical protein
VPTGSYNVTRLLAELGLKNVIEMPVAPTIQPTIPLDTLRGNVPLLQRSVAVYGGTVAAVALEFSAIRVVSLDPGGVSLEWFAQPSGLPLTFTLRVDPLVTGVLNNAVAHPPQIFGNDPVISTVTSGSLVGAPIAALPIIIDIPISAHGRLHLPRGFQLTLEDDVVNSNSVFGLCLSTFGATEAEPA